MKQTARTNKYAKVIELCLEGAKQVEVAKAFDWSPATASRVVNCEEVQRQVAILRAAVLTQSVERFQILVDKSFTVLEAMLDSNLVERHTKARIALKMVEAGMLLGLNAPPTPPSTQERVIALPDTQDQASLSQS